MNATLPINRIGAHFDSPPITRPVLPKGEQARGQLWSDVVFEAVLALRNQLTSRNESVAASAANSILELERTRMRHAKHLAGSRYVNEEQAEFERNPSGMADESCGGEFPNSPEIDPDEPAILGSGPTGARRQVGKLAAAVDEPEPAEETEFENHARTVRNYFANKLFEPMTVSDSVEFVCEKLRGWMLTSGSVPRDKFIEQMRFWGDLPKGDPIWECGSGRRRTGVR